jgi:hypothetical protein
LFTLTIETDNAAFNDGGNAEVARLLREVAERVEDSTTDGTVKDINGNTVGVWASHRTRDLGRSCGGCGAGPYESCDSECQRPER